MPTIHPHPHRTVTTPATRTTSTSTSSTTTSTGRGTTRAADTFSASASSYPKLVKYIDKAQNRLFLHLIHLKDDVVFHHLLDAAKRGVDLHVVVTPKGHMTQEETMRLLTLEGAGVDIVAKKNGKLLPNSGVADNEAFGGRGRGSDALASSLSAFSSALSTHVVTTRRGLLSPGRVALHPMPQSTAAPILNALNAAKKSIDLEVYQLTEPSVVKALTDAAARGVKVRVMLEPKTVETGNYPAMSKKLLAAGIDVKPTPPKFDSKRNVDHAKFMVIDGKELLMGTGNLVRSGLGGNTKPEANNRDFWLEDTRAESLKEGAALFEADWNRKDTAGVNFKNLVVTPDDSEHDVFGLIDSAKKRLYVYNQSLNDDETMKHLLDAKARGVEVHVLLGVQGAPGGVPKNQPAVDQLAAAGCDVQYLTRHYLHAKAIVADDAVFIGSQNFTNGGLENNREVGEVFTQKAIVDGIVKTFLDDEKHPGPAPQ